MKEKTFLLLTLEHYSQPVLFRRMVCKYSEILIHNLNKSEKFL